MQQGRLIPNNPLSLTSVRQIRKNHPTSHQISREEGPRATKTLFTPACPSRRRKKHTRYSSLWLSSREHHDEDFPSFSCFLSEERALKLSTRTTPLPQRKRHERHTDCAMHNPCQLDTGRSDGVALFEGTTTVQADVVHIQQRWEAGWNISSPKAFTKSPLKEAWACVGCCGYRHRQPATPIRPRAHEHPSRKAKKNGGWGMPANDQENSWTSISNDTDSTNSKLLCTIRQSPSKCWHKTLHSSLATQQKNIQSWPSSTLQSCGRSHEIEKQKQILGTAFQMSHAKQEELKRKTQNKQIRVQRATAHEQLTKAYNGGLPLYWLHMQQRRWGLHCNFLHNPTCDNTFILPHAQRMLFRTCLHSFNACL